MKTKDFSGIRSNGSLPDPQVVVVPDDIGDLLDDYVESTESVLGELEQAALAYESGHNREDNSATIRRVLHKIKGESSMVGIDHICEFCHQTEFAFEELPENKRSDMLLKFKDWVTASLCSMTN